LKGRAERSQTEASLFGTAIPLNGGSRRSIVEFGGKFPGATTNSVRGKGGNQKFLCRSGIEKGFGERENKPMHETAPKKKKGEGVGKNDFNQRGGRPA